MHHFALLLNLRIQDVVDILFLSAVAYYLYVWFRQTKAFKALIGLLGLGIVYTLARTWGLFLTTWVFQILWQVLVLLLIILFQSEIRQVLERVNPLRALGLRRSARPEEWVPGFVRGVSRLAERSIGALIIVERSDRVEEQITGGQDLEGAPTPELLMSVFQKDSPLHDGAALIRDGRIARVACYLPLTSAEGLPKTWGTRHRAAVGLTERCDAWVVVVSEERGEISVAREGQLEPLHGGEQLGACMIEAIAPLSQPERRWHAQIRHLFMNRWRAKASSLALVTLLWLLFAGQQDFEVSLSVPIDTRNLPENVSLLSPRNPTVKLTVRGLRKDAATLGKEEVHAEVDLSFAAPGTGSYRIGRDQIRIENENITVVGIEPVQLQFEFGTKP